MSPTRVPPTRPFLTEFRIMFSIFSYFNCRVAFLMMNQTSCDLRHLPGSGTMPCVRVSELRVLCERFFEGTLVTNRPRNDSETTMSSRQGLLKLDLVRVPPKIDLFPITSGARMTRNTNDMLSWLRSTSRTWWKC